MRSGQGQGQRQGYSKSEHSIEAYPNLSPNHPGARYEGCQHTTHFSFRLYAHVHLVRHLLVFLRFHPCACGVCHVNLMLHWSKNGSTAAQQQGQLRLPNSLCFSSSNSRFSRPTKDVDPNSTTESYASVMSKDAVVEGPTACVFSSGSSRRRVRSPPGLPIQLSPHTTTTGGARVLRRFTMPFLRRSPPIGKLYLTRPHCLQEFGTTLPQSQRSDTFQTCIERSHPTPGSKVVFIAPNQKLTPGEGACPQTLPIRIPKTN